MHRCRIFSASSRSIAVVAATSILGLGACSSEQDRGEGFLFLENDALSVCESIEQDPARCAGPVFSVDTFSVLDNAAVEMAEQNGIRYSVDRVKLVQTDPDVGFFKAIPLAADQ